MNIWNNPTVEELNVIATMGGQANGTEGKSVPGNKYNGGTTDPNASVGA